MVGWGWVVCYCCCFCCCCCVVGGGGCIRKLSHCPNQWWSGVCFTNASRALQDILSKCVYCRNRASYEKFKLKLCTCAQSHALGTRTKFQLEILIINVVSSIYFRKIILESLRIVSETPPGILVPHGVIKPEWVMQMVKCHTAGPRDYASICMNPHGLTDGSYIFYM